MAPNVAQGFKKFKDLYEFDHVTSLPTYLQSNGKAENAVNTAQRIMVKALEAGADLIWDFWTSATPPQKG